MIWAVSIFYEKAAAASRLQPQNAGAHHRARAQPGGAGPGARAAGAPGAGAGALALRPGAESAGGAPPSRRVAPCLTWVALGALSCRCPTTGAACQAPPLELPVKPRGACSAAAEQSSNSAAYTLQAPGQRRQICTAGDGAAPGGEGAGDRGAGAPPPAAAAAAGTDLARRPPACELGTMHLPHNPWKSVNMHAVSIKHYLEVACKFLSSAAGCCLAEPLQSKCF